MDLLKRASWKRILIHFLLAGILGTGIITMGFGFIELKPDFTMDSLNYYTGETFYYNLDTQGVDGRRSYLLLHIIDYLFITQFYLFISYTLKLLISKKYNKKRMVLLSLLPLLAGVMDVFENLLIDIAILLYPEKYILIGSAGGIVTSVKMGSLNLSFLLIVVFLIVNIIRRKKPD